MMRIVILYGLACFIAGVIIQKNMIFEERYPKVAWCFMLMQKRILCYMLKFRNQEHTRTTRKWIQRGM